MSVFVKGDAVERIRRAANNVPADAMGNRDVLAQIAAMQAESVAIMRQTMEEEQEHGIKPAYLRAGQLAKYFGVSKPQFLNWLSPLVAQGLVHAIRPKGIDGSDGHARYKVADLEKAWAVSG